MKWFRKDSSLNTYYSLNESADIIERFTNGKSPRFEWDEFTCLKIKDPIIHAVRVKCMEFEGKEEGKHELLKLAKFLRKIEKDAKKLKVEI